MRTHCKNGHEMTPENTYTFRGYTQCKECRKINRRADYHRSHPNPNPRGSKPKEFCIHGHAMTPENTKQRYRNGTKDGKKCIICRRLEQAVYRAQHPEVMNRSRMNSQGHQRYGMVDYLQEREALLAEQGGACAICGVTGLKWGKGFTKVWHVDHPHGQERSHRGVLCATCNTALGKLEPYLEKVITYLAKYAR